MGLLKVWWLGGAALALAGLAGGGLAQGPAGPVVKSSILVPDMHCMNCAKTMAGELYKVPNVGKVLANVDTKILTVHFKDNQAVSPKGLWEAVEKAGFQPTRLEGPNGNFTSRPKF